MFRRKLSALTAIVFLLFLSNYALSTKIKSSWKDPNVTPASFQLKKIFVTAIIKQELVRKVAEDKMVQIIKAGGNADAVASYTIFGINSEITDKDKAKASIADMGFDGAIVMSYAGSKDEFKYTEKDEYSTFFPYNGFWDYYGYGWGAVYNATSNAGDIRVLIETKLFSLKEDKLLWSGISETKNPKNPAKVVGEIADETTKYLQKQGLLPKKK
jgi:CubicO group peptidase (beta-lactamase class C family)